ncbi:P-loop containing nucleoside triphosphate hydrolase protein [Nemania abortiva]|nr:P-loop containing nucleoside triphosphate hydrolase protein [Nemania abortiva]
MKTRPSRSIYPPRPRHTSWRPPQPTPISEVLEILEKEAGGESSSSPAFKVLTEIVESGSECAIQTLYEGQPKCSCCKNWVSAYFQRPKRPARAPIETKKEPLIVRMGKSHQDGKPLVLDSIVVQSRFLKDLIGDVFHGYRGIAADLERLVFRSPFHAFYHRWDVLKELVSNRKDEDSDAAAHAQLLYNLLEIELRDKRNELDNLINDGIITYENLWAIFRPGSLVFSIIEDQNRIFFLQDTHYIQDSFMELHVKFIDWDGTQFGYRSTTLRVCKFSGTQRITGLDAYPIEFHPSRSDVEESVKARGEMFRDMHSFHYVSYKGTMLCGDQRLKIDERIIVDAFSHGRNHPAEALQLEPIDTQELAPTIQVSDDRHAYSSFEPSDFEDDHPISDLVLGGFKRSPITDYGTPSKHEKIEVASDTALTPEQLLLCNSHVRGYSLKSKQWGEFDVTKLRPISWNEAAFPDLVLPEGYRNLILSFIEGHITEDSTFDDIIEGKGLGITMLLVGNPGVGKTLTAEAVADKVRRPLYVLSARELGTDARRVEEHLLFVLEMTERWNAVLLLDECDVFFQKRSADHIAHNEVVAVFLRVFEYYRGILFMKTTNRGDAIDAVFESRIHLTVHYPDLDVAAKRSIWERLITRLDPHNTINDESYAKLSELPLNGRQIRNTVKISLLLASKEKAPLGNQHIWTVLRATGEVGVETPEL